VLAGDVLQTLSPLADEPLNIVPLAAKSTP
jgi:hypothetical protein